MASAYLLDTHALIWWWLGDPALSAKAHGLLDRRETEIHVSAVTGFEIAQKVRSGKLDAMTEPLSHFDEEMVSDALRHLAVRHEHAIMAGLLEGRHRDPFDRLIAAQALIEGLTVVTRDPAFRDFGCEVLW